MANNMANMDTEKPKSNSAALEAEADVRIEAEEREGERRTAEQIQQQDLNQGMDTGTHSSTHRGVNWGPAYRVVSEREPLPREAEIAARAYELYLLRGGEDGHDVDDWLAAENELRENRTEAVSVPLRARAAGA